MTAPQDLHERIDRLPPESLPSILAAIEEQERIQKHLEALCAFQADWTPEEQAA